MLALSPEWGDEERITLKTFGFALCYTCVFGTASAEYITSNIAGDILYIAEDTIISPDVSMDFNAINIVAPLYLQNQGRIFGDIIICDNCRTYIRNSGTIYGDIHVGNDANLIQVITSADDITPLNVFYPHELLIYRAKDMDWNNITESAYNISTITIVDSVIYLSPEMRLAMRNEYPSIEIMGENEIHLGTIVEELPILHNISGDGKITLYVDNLNPLYVAQAVIRDGNMYADIVRETDYLKILGADTGMFLNNLRTQNPSDKLLQKLDAAPDMPEINHILNKSMRINTRRLNYPLKTLSRHMRTNNSGAQPLHAQPFVIFGSNISAYGARAGITLHPSSALRLSINANATTMGFSDGIDDFSGNAIGMNMAALYSHDKIYTHMNIGASKAYLETPILKTHNGTGRNPRGSNAYADIDFGRRLNVNPNMGVTPFVGLSGEYTYVLNTDYDLATRFGIIAEYKYTATELEYAFGVRIATDTLNVNYIDTYIDIISPDDGFTFRSALGQLHDEMDVSYSITASLIFNF